jgi:hypothetical protein
MAFYNKFQGEEEGSWDGRTVWSHTAALRFSVWGGLIKGEAPIAFWTDFASVPRHCHMYDIFGGRCNREADIHDLTYRKGAEVQYYPELLPAFVEKYGKDNLVCEWLKEKESGMVGDIPKSVADLIFKQLMIEQGRPYELYKPMYLAVKFAGASSFHKFKVMDRLPLDEEY